MIGNVNIPSGLTRLISLFATVVLMWVLVTKDQLRCFARHDHHKKATFKSSCIAPKNWNTLHQVNTKLMRLYTFEFRTAICMNVWLVKGQKAKPVQIYHVHSMDKISGSKRLFSSWIWDGACNRALHDCNLCAMTRYALKKRCGLWLTFFATWPRRSSIYEPYEKPLFHLKNLCTKTPSTNNRLTAGWIFERYTSREATKGIFWALYWQDPLLLNISVANV